VSPKSGGRAQKRQRRNLLISVLVVVAISIGSFAAVFAAKWTPRLGLDLAGGVSVVYTAEGHNISQSDLNETVNILNLRVNGLGVSGAEVQTTGKNQISVSIPGVTNAQQVLDQIGQTARMYFRPVLCYAYPQAVPKHSKVKPQPGVAVIKSVDGLGPKGAKLNTYHFLMRTTAPGVHAGFKLFFDEDRQNGAFLMSPGEVMALAPRPEYVMYE